MYEWCISKYLIEIVKNIFFSVVIGFYIMFLSIFIVVVKYCLVVLLYKNSI